MKADSYTSRAALTFAGSQTALRAAEAKAIEIGRPMCIAIVDSGGRLMAFSRQDGARIGSINLAITKAVSGAMRLRSTTDEGRLRPDDPTHTIRMALAAGVDQMTSINGGFPIVHDRQVVGGIGVSNGLRHEDIAVAEAGLEAIESEEAPVT